MIVAMTVRHPVFESVARAVTRQLLKPENVARSAITCAYIFPLKWHFKMLLLTLQLL